MRHFKRLILFFMVITASNALGSQLVIESDHQFDYASQLDKTGDYETAVVEFKRFIHFFPEDDRAGQASFLAGRALYRLGRFNEAAKRFDRIIRKGGDQGHVIESFFFQSRAFMGMGNTALARVVLHNLLTLTDDRQIQDRIYSLLADMDVKASGGLDEQRLAKARASLDKISDAGAKAFETQTRINTLDKALDIPQKNPKLAGGLAFVPGGGYLYCGRYQDALVSFLLNSAFIMASYKAFDQDNPALGGITAFVGTGFYTGNIYGSVTAAHRFNRQARKRILTPTFSLDPGPGLSSKSWMINLKYSF